MPFTYPAVHLQDFIDAITLPHEGGDFPYSSHHGSQHGPNCSVNNWHGDDWIIPGTASFAGYRGAWWWFELASEEISTPPGTPTKVVFHDAGFATLSRQTGEWTRRVYGIENLVATGYVWSGNVGGLYTLGSDADGPTVGWGSLGSNGYHFGDLVYDSATGTTGRIRAHGWDGRWPAPLFWSSLNPNSSTSTSNPAITQDIAACVWWVTCKGGNGNQYRIMPGVDYQKDGDPASNLDVNTRGGYNGRARIIPTDGSWITAIGTTASEAQLRAYPPTIVPGYTAGTVSVYPDGNPRWGHSKTQDNVFPTFAQGSKITNIPVYGWGQKWPIDNPNVSAGEKDYGTLIQAAVDQAVNDGQQFMLTLATCPEYFRLPGGLSGFNGINEAPDPAKEAELAADYVAMVERWFGQGLRLVQIWNEMKGMWSTANGHSTGAAGQNRWDYERYTRFYNTVYDGIKALAPSVQVAGPYFPLRKRNDGHDITVSTSLGPVSFSQRDIDVLTYWLAHTHGYDAVCFDGDFSPQDWPRVIEYIRSLLPAETPIIISEFYWSTGVTSTVHTWDRTVNEIGLADDQSAASAFYSHGTASSWLTPPGVVGRLTLPWDGFGAWPIYNASNKTTDKKIWYVDYASTTFTDGGTIPWNPAWIPSTSDDHGLLIDEDVDAGVNAPGWEIWRLVDPWWDSGFDNILNPIWAKGWRRGDLLAGTINRRTTSNIGSYIARGGGAIPKRAGIPTAAEVATANLFSRPIPHALSGVGINLITGTGINAKFVAPATRIEHPEGQSCGITGMPNNNDSRLMPEGVRMVLNITDAEITAWLDSRGYAGNLRQTAATFARTLRDYGIIFWETGCGEPQIECEGIGNPAFPSYSTWQTLGLTSLAVARDLLDGLITPTNLRVVNPENVNVAVSSNGNLNQVTTALGPVLDSSDTALWWSETQFGTFTVPGANPNTGSTNHAPVVTNPGTKNVQAGHSTSIPITATDADSDTLYYAAAGLPKGLVINSSTGVISGIPESGTEHDSPYHVTIIVSDGQS